MWLNTIVQWKVLMGDSCLGTRIPLALLFKGIETVVSCKGGNANGKPWILYLIQNVEETVVFLNKKFLRVFPLVFINKECACHCHFRREIANENKQFKETYTWIPSSYSWSDKAFEETAANRALPSLHRGSLEITLTVLLNKYINLIYS